MNMVINVSKLSVQCGRILKEQAGFDRLYGKPLNPRAPGASGTWPTAAGCGQ